MRHISTKGDHHPDHRGFVRGQWLCVPRAPAAILACGLALLASQAKAAAPEFDANLPSTVSVTENSAIGTNIGSPFTATDDDDDDLTYSVEGTDSGNFKITSSGQLQTDAHIDYEAKTSHSVTLRVADATESDTHNLTINVSNQSDTGDSSLTPSEADPTVARKSRATYSIRINGTWTTSVTPGGLPSGDHFTTFVGGIHNDQVSFLTDGGTATSGVESMAEIGGTTGLRNEVNAQRPNADRAVTFGAPGVTGSRTHTGVTFTSDHPRITLASMIAPSPDWFVGISGRTLLNSSGNWLSSLTVNLYPWDAGTENGTEFSLSNPATNPRGVITSIRGRGKFTGAHIAQLVFTRTGSVELVPAAPSGLGATASDGAVTLDWDLPTDTSITGHEYRQKTTGGYGSWISITGSGLSGSNNDSFTISPLDNNTQYTFQLRAVNGVGDGVVSGEVSTTPMGATNTAPSFSSSSTFGVDENTTAVGTVSAGDSDEDDDVSSYEITGGADRSRFTINSTTGALAFNNAPNFESPRDAASSDPVNAAGNNEYLMVVTAKSGSGAREMSAEQTITVTVRDVNEPPTMSATAAFDVDENTTAVGTVVASDVDAGDQITGYEITGGADRSRFTIGRTTGALTFSPAPDFENPTDTGNNNEYQVVVTAKGGAGAREMSVEQTITVTVLDINEPPRRPAAPTLSSRTSSSLTVAWTAPDNAGRPDITSYDLQYMETGGSFSNGPQNQTGSSAQIAGLDPGTEYQVQVRATNDEGDSLWSQSLTASTQSADAANLTLSLSDTQISERGGSATITASLNRTASASITVTISATPVSPTLTSDFSLSSNRVLTIAANSLESTGTVTLTAVDNDIDGPNKTVTISGVATSNSDVSDPASLSLLIQDEDTRGVRISPSSLEIDEGETDSYTVVLNSEPIGIVRVRPARESSDTDITLSGALSFNSNNWNIPQTVTVTAAEDADAVDDSAVISNRVSGGDYGDVTASSVAVTATDNDPVSAGVTLSVTPTSVGEADGTRKVMVTATLSDGVRDSDTDIDVTVGSGTAIAGTDFDEVEAFSITIAENSDSGTGEFILIPTDDALYEVDETVQVMGSSSVEGLAVRGASVTIESDDQGPPLNVRAVPDKSLTAGRGWVRINLDAFFTHPDGDPLTYSAESADDGIASVSVVGASLTVTPVAVGVARVRATGKDTDGSGEQGSVEFRVLVELEEQEFSLSPDADDVWTLTFQGRSGPLRITLPPGQGRKALDSDEDGDVDAEDIEATLIEIEESEVAPAPQDLDIDERSAVDINFSNPPSEATLICLSTSWSSSLPLAVARLNASTDRWEWLPSDLSTEGTNTSVCAETKAFSVFAVLDGSGRDVSIADLNDNEEVDAEDALVMYYAFAFKDLLGDSSGPGVARYRRALLSDSLSGNPSDADLRGLLRRAKDWRDKGISLGGDLNGDSMIDEQDALVMYYAYKFEDRLGTGETGGDTGLRERLLAGLSARSDATDAILKGMLRRANSLRRAQ